MHGDYDEALKALGQAVDAVGDDPARLGPLLNTQGTVLTLVRRYDQARLSLDQAFIIAQKLGDTGLQSQVLNSQGNLALRQRQWDAAMESYRQSAAIAAQAGDDAGATLAMLNQAALATRLNRDDAVALTQQIAQRLSARPASTMSDSLHLNLGQTQARLRQSRAAHDSYQRALEQARAVDDRQMQSQALGALAELYRDARRDDEALTLARQAAFLAQESRDPTLLCRWQWLIGRCHRRLEHADDAIAALTAAVETLESIKSDVVLGFGNLYPDETFRSTMGPLYYELADLLLRRASALADHQAKQASLREARDVVEKLKGAELADYFQDQCVARMKQKSRLVDDVAADTAVLYIIPLPDRTELLLGLSDGLHQVRCDVAEAALAQQVRLMREGLEDRTTFDFMTPARQIHTWLIAPIQATLDQRGITTLVIVPDGALRTIPMAALHDGSRFLAEKYATAVAPGLTLMDPQPIARREGELLVAALSRSVQGFPPLEHVPQEIDDLQRLYGGTVLMNERFRTPAFERRVEAHPFTVVHIASHGQFGSDARSTFVLTYDDRLTLDGLERLIRPTQFRRQPVELLSLSACQTAAGDDRAALGLAGIAVKSGARSALATLWFVNDQASSRLVADFYRILQEHPTLSKAHALRQAQVQLMGDPRYRHPCYWAPYLVIGNWL
jgi:CHAT domain-containing protein/Tfp pilus assembly protein PilF